MPFRQLLKSPYQYFKNRNGIFRELKLNLRWEQWSNILIWQLFENLPEIKYFLAYMLTGQLVQRLRLFYRSKTIFVWLLPLSDEPSEWLCISHCQICWVFIFIVWNQFVVLCTCFIVFKGYLLQCIEEFPISKWSHYHLKGKVKLTIFIIDRVLGVK